MTSHPHTRNPTKENRPSGSDSWRSGSMNRLSETRLIETFTPKVKPLAVFSSRERNNKNGTSGWLELHY